jgi:hypothetical protein
VRWRWVVNWNGEKQNRLIQCIARACRRYYGYNTPLLLHTIAQFFKHKLTWASRQVCRPGLNFSVTGSAGNKKQKQKS